MSNHEFIELYEQTRENHNKLHNMHIDDLTVWFVSGMNKRESAMIADCRDFGAITVKGSVIITHGHGTWLKVTDQYWVDVLGGQDNLAHDLDLVWYIIAENKDGRTATIIDPQE